MNYFRDGNEAKSKHQQRTQVSKRDTEIQKRDTEMEGIQAAVTSFIIDIDFFSLNIIQLILLVTRHRSLEPKQK